MESFRQNMELVIARLETISANNTDDPRTLADEALVCARAALASQAAPQTLPPLGLDTPMEVKVRVAEALLAVEAYATAVADSVRNKGKGGPGLDRQVEKAQTAADKAIRQLVAAPASAVAVDENAGLRVVKYIEKLDAGLTSAGFTHEQRMKIVRLMTDESIYKQAPAGEPVAEAPTPNAPPQDENIFRQALAVELMGVKEQMADGAGFWRPCSGCYETEDGHAVGSYPYSDVFRCALGGGCHECGGIGAVWDSTDYEAMAEGMQREDEKDAAPVANAGQSEAVFHNDGKWTDWACYNAEELRAEVSIEWRRIDPAIPPNITFGETKFMIDGKTYTLDDLANAVRAQAAQPAVEAPVRTDYIQCCRNPNCPNCRGHGRYHRLLPSQPAGDEQPPFDKEKALAQFTDYFVRNYPGPDTLIHDPKWHAPRIFNAALNAITKKA